MADDEDRPRPKIVHEIGAPLDTLSIRDFDEAIACLEAEIARLRAAKSVKQSALDQAGSIFKSG